MASKRRAIIALIGALVLATGALLVSPADAASGLDPLAVAQVQKANCQLLAAKSTGTQRQRARDCVTDQQRIIDLLTPVATTPPVVPTTTPPATQPSPTTPPPATTVPPSPTPTAPPQVVHGRDITTANTGYLAWVGPNGQRCTDATMTVYTTRKSVTDFPANSLTGRAFTCVWFQAGLIVDATATVTAGRFTGGTTGSDCEGGVYVLCAWGVRLAANWSTVDGSGFNCEIAAMGHVDLYRTQLGGCSDGVRFDSTNVVESYVRVRQLNSADHNDAVQAYQASAGGSILRSNIDGRPVNASAFGNAAIFLADNSRGEAVIRDNWLAGGGYTLRLHEAMTYRVTGNVLSDWGFGPLTTTNAVGGAFLEFAGNVTDGGAAVALG